MNIQYQRMRWIRHQLQGVYRQGIRAIAAVLLHARRFPDD